MQDTYIIRLHLTACNEFKCNQSIYVTHIPLCTCIPCTCVYNTVSMTHIHTHTHMLVLPPSDAKLKGAPLWLEGLDLQVVVSIWHQLLYDPRILAVTCIIVTDPDHLGPVIRAEEGYNDVTVTMGQDGVLGTRVLVSVEANEEFSTCS